MSEPGPVISDDEVAYQLTPLGHVICLLRKELPSLTMKRAEQVARRLLAEFAERVAVYIEKEGRPHTYASENTDDYIKHQGGMNRAARIVRESVGKP